MTDKEIEKKLYHIQDNKGCCEHCFGELAKNSLGYISRLKSQKQLAETQLKELLSALYQRTEKPFTLERQDIVDLAKDYGIKEEELK